MADKPQFKVYLPQAVIDGINEFATAAAMPNGKAVEFLWRFFRLEEPNALADRIERWCKANPYQPGRSPIGLVRLGAVINNWVNKK